MVRIVNEGLRRRRKTPATRRPVRGLPARAAKTALASCRRTRRQVGGGTLVGSDLEASPPSMKSLVLAFLLSPLPLLAQQPQLALQTVATGLNQPVDLVHAGDSRLFIVLQPGQIVIYDGTRILPTPFLDIRSLVLCCGERGLLGLAFHPQYAQNGFFFVYYTDLNGDINIVRYNVSSNRNVADASSA